MHEASRDKAWRVALTSRKRSSSANCAVFIRLMMPASGQAVLADFVARHEQTHAHEFHYDTGAPLLYWFGTQPILANRSNVSPLAKLLILEMFLERWRAPWPWYCTGDLRARTHTM